MKVSNELINSTLLKAIEIIKEQEAIEENFIEWQKTYGIWEEFSEANDLVSNLGSKDPDFDKANEWFIENQDKLTIEKLHLIILIAIRHGTLKFTINRHPDTEIRDKLIKDLWKKYKAKGMSKTQAALLIAPLVGLSPVTVRDKLKEKKKKSKKLKHS